MRRWAEQVIEHDPQPPQAFFEIVSVLLTDLSALRYAVWLLVTEPEPPAVLEAVFGLLDQDLASGHRGFTDTITVLRQIRSMLRLPPPMYAGFAISARGIRRRGGEEGYRGMASAICAVWHGAAALESGVSA